MKSINQLFLSILGATLLLWGCQPASTEIRVTSLMDQVVDTLGYQQVLDSAASKETLTYSQVQLLKGFIEAYSSKLAPEWTYGEVLRRAQGRAEMVDNGLKGEVTSLAETTASPEDPLVKFMLSVRCQNALQKPIDVFSTWVVLRNQEGEIVFSTSYLTNVQPLAAEAWSAVMPFEIQLRRSDAPTVDALRTLTKSHSEVNFDFKMAYVKFTNGPTLDEYWLSAER